MKLRLSYKKLLFAVVMLLCIIPQNIMAQNAKVPNLWLYDEKPYHFGFIIALNNMSYAIDCKENYQNALYQFKEHPDLEEYSPTTVNRISGGNGDIFDDDNLLFYNRSIVSVPHTGFTVGIVGDLRLGRYFDLRLIPSLSFGTKIIKYNYDFAEYTKIENDVYMNISKSYEESSSILATIMEFPLHIKYKSKRHHNLAAYVIGGGNPKLDFSFLFNKDAKRIQAKTFDFAAEIGAGFDYYTHYFKMGIEAKFSFGLLDVLDKCNNQYDASINSLKNRMFQVSLTFE